MGMTKEDLLRIYQEQYAAIIEGEWKLVDNFITICLILSVVVIVLLVGYSLKGKANVAANIFVTAFALIAGAILLYFIVDFNDTDGAEKAVEFKTDLLLPYLFENELAREQAERYDDIKISLETTKAYQTVYVDGTITYTNDAGKEVTLKFKDVGLGRTDNEKSYLKVNTLDVDVSKVYVKGQQFNMLYLNELDYETLTGVFGELPMRAEEKK